MRKLIIIVVLSVSNAFASDIITLKHGVEFDHWGHQTERVGVCKVCHEQAPGKIAGFGRSWAHKNCIGCHDLYQAGPRRCGGCHKLNGEASG